MRTIKFRIWNTITNRFVVGVTLFDAMRLYIPSQADRTEETVVGLQDDTPFVYEQFTGRLDKNGKEIYEGDVVRRLDYPLHAVEWPFYFVGDTETEYEVFGNIHEHAHLLKDELVAA